MAALIGVLVIRIILNSYIYEVVRSRLQVWSVYFKFINATRFQLSIRINWVTLFKNNLAGWLEHLIIETVLIVWSFFAYQIFGSHFFLSLH